MGIKKPLSLDPNFGTPAEMSASLDILSVGGVSANGVNGISFNANGGSLINLATPVNATDGVCKSYVDSIAAGLTYKNAVKALSNTNIASMSGATTIDGVAVGAGTRVLLIGQTTASQNGIWVVQSGAWTRPTDFATGASEAGAAVFVDAGGSTYGSQGWVCTASPGSDVVDTSNLTWTQYSGLGEVTTSYGLAKSGNTIFIQMASNNGLQFTGGALDTLLTPGGSLSKSATGLQVQLSGSTLSSSSAGLAVLGLPTGFTVGGVNVDGAVTAANLSALNDGPTSLVDNLHGHARVLSAQTVSAVHTNGSVALAAGDPVMWSSTANVLQRCDSSAVATAQVIGVAATAAAASATVAVVKRGVVPGVLTGATPGTPYYLQSGGGLVAGLPTGSAVSICKVGWALNSTDLECFPQAIGTRSAT